MAKDEKVVVRLDLEQRDALDRLRVLEPGVPSRAEMFRRLLARAVEAAEAKKKPSVS
jgi:hypothetical protein